MSAPASPTAPLLGRALLVAWVVWLLGALNYGHAFFQRTNPSAMTDDLMREFGVSATALGNLAAVYMYAYAALQIPAGVAFDRWGPRAILAGAAACCAAGAILFGLAPSIEVAMLGRLLIGAGAGFSFLDALTLTMIWFPRERYDVMIGFIPPVGIAGAVLGQAPFGALVEALGWRPAILATAALAALLACLFWASRRVPAPLAHTPDGHAEPLRPHLLAGLRRAVRDPQTWLLGVSSGFNAGPFLAFGALWAVPWLMQVRGIDRLGATSSASVILLGLALGSPLAGWLSNRLRRRKAVLVGFNGLSLVVWAAPDLLAQPARRSALSAVRPCRDRQRGCPAQFRDCAGSFDHRALRLRLGLRQHLCGRPRRAHPAPRRRPSRRELGRHPYRRRTRLFRLGLRNRLHPAAGLDRACAARLDHPPRKPPRPAPRVVTSNETLP